MRQFYVRFAGDNDFINTVARFVKDIAPQLLIEQREITKAQVVLLFNSTAYALHMFDTLMTEDVEHYKC